MKVCYYTDVEPREPLPGVTLREVITGADGAPTFRMRVIEFEPEKSTSSHNHPFEHEIFILSGQGIVEGEQEEKTVREGDVIFIPPDEQHCITNNGREILRIICCVPLYA